MQTHPRQINNENDQRAAATVEPTTKSSLFEVPYICPLRLDSSQAAQKFEAHSVDFVYVDAEHTYAAAARDVASWWPKLKSGGVLAGDDCCFFDGYRDEFSVRRAVMEFFMPRGIQIHVQPGDPNPEWEQWLVLKPG